MDPERHLHFNVLSGLWLYLFLLAFLSAMRFVLTKWHVPGLSELHTAAFGSL
jgi:hypothetical protein